MRTEFERSEKPSLNSRSGRSSPAKNKKAGHEDRLPIPAGLSGSDERVAERILKRIARLQREEFDRDAILEMANDAPRLDAQPD